MTVSETRSTAPDSAAHAATKRSAAQRESAPAAERCPGTYTDRHDRPHPAPRPEGSYVSGAKRRSAPGRYTDVDGGRNRRDHTDGYYTQRD